MPRILPPYFLEFGIRVEKVFINTYDRQPDPPYPVPYYPIDWFVYVLGVITLQPRIQM